MMMMMMMMIHARPVSPGIAQHIMPTVYTFMAGETLERLYA
jgi:hypothetical protein